MATGVSDLDKEYVSENMGESQNILESDETKASGSAGIIIEVCNPRVKDDTFNKYVSYTVKGVDQHGPFEVIRRYSDFDKVRSLFVAKWPGCYIPPLPPKALNSMEAKFIKERRRYLHLFCQKVAAIPMLHYYTGYQDFLRSKNPSLEKVFQPLLKTDYAEMIERYTTNFTHLKENEYNLAIIKKISEFKTFLRKVQAKNQNVKKYANSMVRAKNVFYKNFANLNNQVSMEYEKNVFSLYHNKTEGKNVFTGDQYTELMEHAAKIDTASAGASLEYLEEWYKAESREFEALIDAIAGQENYANLKMKAIEKQKSDAEDLQKVLAGKSTIKGVFLRKTKEEEVKELEKQLEKSTQDLDHLTLLNDMITLILAYDEIEKFKNGKMRPYYRCVMASAQKELETLTTIEEYWTLVLQNQNLDLAE